MPLRTCRYAHPLFTASAPTDWPRQRRSGSFPSACTGLRWFELTTPFHDETECHFLSRCSCHGSVVLLHPEISLLPTLPSYCKAHDRQTEQYLLVYHQNVEKFVWIYITDLNRIVANYIYLVTNVTNQNYMHEDASNWLNSKDVCYHLVQTDMYFSFYLEAQRLKYIKT